MLVDKFLRPISATLRFDLLVRFLLHRVRELLFINFLFLFLKSKVNVRILFPHEILEAVESYEHFKSA